jgi:hypothetical protein
VRNQARPREAKFITAPNIQVYSRPMCWFDLDEKHHIRG